MKSLPIIGQNAALVPAAPRNYEAETQKFSTWGGKLLQHTDVLHAIQRERVFRPITVQLGPTELCDSDCAFCSVANRPQDKKIAWADIDRGLREFRELGAKSLEITGSGNPLLYKDSGRNINDIICLAHELGYRIGIITNTEKLSRHIRPEHANKIDWIRISLIKLDEGKNPEDYNFTGFPIEKLAFSYIIYGASGNKAGTTPATIARIAQLVELNPGIKFVRLAADCLTDESLTVKAQWGDVIAELDKHGKFFIKEIGDDYHAYQGGCWVGMIRPYWVHDGVYICTSHVLIHRTYHPTWKLCGHDNIKATWTAMNERFAVGHPPYEIDIAGECKHCYYFQNNSILSHVVNRLPDADFA